MPIRIAQVKESGAAAPSVVARRDGAAAGVAALQAVAGDVETFAAEARPVAEVVATHDGFRAARGFADAALACSDDQRGYGALKDCAERLIELAAQSDDRTWPRVLATAADMLASYLEQRPAEPLLLNYLGVCLHELNEPRAARSLFRRAAELAPDTPAAETNLAEAERRLREPVPSNFAPEVRARLRPLASHAERIVARAAPAAHQTISLCMIVKDEEELLPACLDSVRDHVDELIVVDTGSSDRTREIALERGARVIDFPWTGSFAEARNVSLDASTGDWILYLDADEQVVDEDGAKLRELVRQTWREGFYLVETNFTGVEDLGGSVNHLAFRLFRNRPQYRFEGAVHEQKLHTFPLELQERFLVTDVRLNHYGYLKQRIVDRDKQQRNLELLEREARERPSPFNDFNVGSEYAWQGDHATARTHFQRALDGIRSNPNWRESQFAPILVERLARSIHANDPEAAREFIGQALEWYPEHTDLVFELGVLALDAERLDEAERLFRRCLELGDAPLELSPIAGRGTFQALRFLGETLRRKGDAAGALACFERCAREWPRYSPVLLDLTTILLELDADHAAQRVETIEFEHSAAACMFIAMGFYEARALDAAEVWYRRALDVSAEHAPSLVGLGETYLSLRRWDDAERLLARVPAAHPLEPAALRARCFAAICAGALDAAERHADALAERAPADGALYRAWVALERDPDAGPPVPEAAALLCLTNLEALLRVEEFDRFERLLPAFETAVRDERVRRTALAKLYERHEFDGLAVDEWEGLVRRFGPNADALYGLGRAATKQELWSDAAVLLEGALQADPGHVAARALLGLVAPRA